MRVLLRLLVVLGAIVAAAWIGGEMLIARKAAALIGDDPQVSAAAVRELREPRRIGVRAQQLELEMPDAVLALPWLDLWVPPQRPNQINASLPPTLQITRGGRPAALTLEDGALNARFAPAKGFALGAARLGAGAVTLDGRRVADRVEVDARLVGFGADAPRAAGAAYDVSADIGGVSLGALTGGVVPGEGAVSGGGRLWLDRAPARGGSALPPRLVGLRADGTELRLDDLTAQVWGRVLAGPSGTAEGELMIDTTDAEGFIARAADLGFLPRSLVPLVTAVIGGLAGGIAVDTDAVDTTPPGSGGPAAASLVERPTPPGAAALPPLREGALRIPLGFREGQTWLGPMPIGPAPRFPG